jgi:hypothetical protein
MFLLHHLGRRIRAFGIVDSIAWGALIAATIISLAKHRHMTATADGAVDQATHCCAD